MGWQGRGEGCGASKGGRKEEGMSIEEEEEEDEGMSREEEEEPDECCAAMGRELQSQSFWEFSQ